MSGGNAEESCIRLATRIIETVSRPISLPEGIAKVGASIGIAIFPEGQTTIERCIQKADAAMCQAKKAGKGCFALADYDESHMPEPS